MPTTLRQSRKTRRQYEIPLLPHQAEFVNSTAGQVALIAGRGAGKTWAGACRLLLRALLEPGSYAVVAPTYTMLEDLDWPAVMQVAETLHIRPQAMPGKMLMRVFDSEIRFRSADRPDRLRGLNLRGLWLDEAAQIDEEAWLVLRPALRIGPAPWLGVTTTPKGTAHWTYRLFGPHAVNTHVVRARTADNPFLDEAVRASLYADIVGIWARQELEAEWCDPEGVEWPAEFWGDWVLTPTLPPVSRMSPRVIAVDPSLGLRPDQGDYSAIVALGWSDGLVWAQADIARRPTHQIVEDTFVLADFWKPHAIGVEAVAFQHVLINEFARQRVLPYPVFAVQADGPKELRIRRLGPTIVRRELRILDDKGGRLLYQQLRYWPQSDYDDGPDALEMAVRLAMNLTQK